MSHNSHGFWKDKVKQTEKTKKNNIMSLKKEENIFWEWYSTYYFSTQKHYYYPFKKVSLQQKFVYTKDQNR